VVRADPADLAPIKQAVEPVRGHLTNAAGGKDPARCTTATLCELLNRIWAGAWWFKEDRPAAEELLRKVLADVSPRKSPNDPRDRFIYRMRKAGRSHNWIRCEVEKRKNWAELASDRAVFEAGRRYAERNALPWPIQR
jgi:hypothetical protein